VNIPEGIPGRFGEIIYSILLKHCLSNKIGIFDTASNKRDVVLMVPNEFFAMSL